MVEASRLLTVRPIHEWLVGGGGSEFAAVDDDNHTEEI